VGIEVHKLLRFVRQVSQGVQLANIWSCDYLVRSLRLVGMRITGDVHVEEIVVQRLACGSIGTIWHVPIIPVVDILDSFRLIWRILVAIKVDLVKFGQIGPTDRRGCLPR
jgi:hypothetical protein